MVLIKILVNSWLTSDWRNGWCPHLSQSPDCQKCYPFLANREEKAARPGADNITLWCAARSWKIWTLTQYPTEPLYRGSTRFCFVMFCFPQWLIHFTAQFLSHTWYRNNITSVASFYLYMLVCASFASNIIPIIKMKMLRNITECLKANKLSDVLLSIFFLGYRVMCCCLSFLNNILILFWFVIII